MPTPTNLLPPGSTSAPGPVAPEYVAPPAVVARWERILNGQVEPGDYLTLPPDATRWVEFEFAFAEDRLKGVPLDADYKRDILRDRALDYHYGGNVVATIHRPEGVIVLAVGIDEIALLYRTITGERLTGVGTENPHRW